VSLLARILGRPQGSAANAKDRLQLVLVHDRMGLSPGKIDLLKDELIEVISRHVEIDSNRVEISLSKDRDRQRLVADIPLAAPRSRRRSAY
jgi:cell division topological specificity factor